jgi:hypothetical protein
LLERQIGRLENYPEMTNRMRQHLEESRLQVYRPRFLGHRIEPYAALWTG